MQHYRSSILRKIIKIVATRCHILRLKCTKFNLGWGSAPDTPTGELTALPRPPSWISGVSFQAQVEKGRKGRESGNKSPEWFSQKLGSTQLNCTQFDQLILKKIVKIVANRCHFKAKMHQI